MDSCNAHIQTYAEDHNTQMHIIYHGPIEVCWIDPFQHHVWEQEVETSSRLWCWDPFSHHDPQLTAKTVVGPQGVQSRNEGGDSSKHLIGYCWSSVSDGVSFVLHSLWLCQLHVMFRCLKQLLLCCVSHILYPSVFVLLFYCVSVSSGLLNDPLQYYTVYNRIGKINHLK